MHSSGGVMLRVGNAVRIIGILAAASAALVSCNKAPPPPPSTAQVYANVPGGPHAVPAASASPADDGNWVMPGKDYAASRFSGLSQITPANVKKMSLAFTFSTGTTTGFEAPPLVVNGTM